MTKARRLWPTQCPHGWTAYPVEAGYVDEVGYGATPIRRPVITCKECADRLDAEQPAAIKEYV